GGRYGSVGTDGISYTEMEYRYASEIGKPIIAFLHKDPGTLPANKTEQSEEGRKKLDDFKELAQKKMCKYWTSPDNLGSVVSRSLIQLIKNTPAIGWIKADQMASVDATKEILRLRQQVDDLQREIEQARITAPKGSELLAQGDDKFQMHFIISCSSELGEFFGSKSISSQFLTTWNNIFSVIAPSMIHECREREMRRLLNTFIRDENESQFKKKLATEKLKLQGFSITENDLQTIKVQLRALGLITMSQKRQRSVKDTDTYWTLTPYGNEVMNSLRAIRRPTRTG
ncbi:MAG TPA: hypothetical protein PLY09_01345, partial [Methanothrix sp.]|nr:hypothetical protein [Methanothrix sp.]